MKRVLVAGLLLVATSASAGHVWRLWCGHPPTKRGARRYLRRMLAARRHQR
jgi:hypothetical protein